jgi:hypothetical protein
VVPPPVTDALEPEKVAVRLELVPLVTVVGDAVKLVMLGAATVVMVSGLEAAEVPAAFVTVSVNVVVCVNATETGVPLVIAIWLLFLLFVTIAVPPVPALKTPVSVVEVPAVMVVAPAVKLVSVGAATAVTETVAVTDVPAELVTVRVYTVVALEGGVTTTAVPLVALALTPPPVTAPVPPANEGLRLELAPFVTVVGDAVKPVMAGAATTLTVAVVVAIVPAAFVTVSV